MLLFCSALCGFSLFVAAGGLLTRLAPKFQAKYARRVTFYSDPKYRMDLESLQWLPFLAFSKKTLDKYMLQGMDYLAFWETAHAHLIRSVPG